MIETEFTIKRISVDKALKEAEQKAEKTAQKIDRTLNQPGGNGASAAKTVQETSQAAQKGLDAVGKAGSGVANVMKNVIGGFTALLNPVSLVTAAVGVLVSLVAKYFKDAKDKAEQVKEAMKWDVTEGGKHLESTLKEGGESTSYMRRLYEINQMETIDNATKLEAVRIIDLLTMRYGDLGLSIDDTTGRIFGLTEAMRRQQRLAREAAKAELEGQVAKQGRVVESAKQELADTTFVSTTGWRGEQFVAAFAPLSDKDKQARGEALIANPTPMGKAIRQKWHDIEQTHIKQALSRYYELTGSLEGAPVDVPKYFSPTVHYTEQLNNLMRQQAAIMGRIRDASGEERDSLTEELEILRKIIAVQRVLDLSSRMVGNRDLSRENMDKWRNMYAEAQTQMATLMKLRSLVATGDPEGKVQRTQTSPQSPQARERAVISQQDKLTQKRFEVASVGATEGEKYGIVLAQERRQASRVREEEARLKKLIAEYEALQKRFAAAGAKPRKQNGTFVNAEDEAEFKRLESELEAARRRMQEQETRTVDAEAARLDYQKRLREMEVATQKSLRESNERLAVKREEMQHIGETPSERIGRLKIRLSDYIDSLLIMGDELDEIEDKERELRRMLNQTQGDRRKEIETQLAELAQERLRKEQEIATTKIAQLDIDKQIREYEINQARQEAARSMQGMAQFFSPALPDLVRRGGSMRGANGPAEANLKILNAVLIANRYLQYIRINTANGGIY